MNYDLDKELMANREKRRQEVFKVMGVYEPWEIAETLGLTERVVKTDLEFLEQKLEGEKTQLKHLTRSLSLFREAYDNYKNAEDPPTALHWWVQLANMNKQIGDYIKKSDIIFLREEIPKMEEEKGIIQQLREEQERWDEKRKKKKLVMK